MQKTAIHDWRITRPLKDELEEAARAEEKSVAELLEQIVREWLQRFQHRTETEEELQQRIRAAAAPFIGSIHGGGRARSENVRSEVRSRLARKYGR